jgi:hypothetical protein
MQEDSHFVQDSLKYRIRRLFECKTGAGLATAAGWRYIVIPMFVPGHHFDGLVRVRGENCDNAVNSKLPPKMTAEFYEINTGYGNFLAEGARWARGPGHEPHELHEINVAYPSWRTEAIDHGSKLAQKFLVFIAKQDVTEVEPDGTEVTRPYWKSKTAYVKARRAMFESRSRWKTFWDDVVWEEPDEVWILWTGQSGPFHTIFVRIRAYLK